MAHGITLDLRNITAPAPGYVHQHPTEGTGIFARPVGATYVNTTGTSDRSLNGKARRRARKAARGLARRPFFKGHGVASENAYNQRYDCPCPSSIVAPLDDFDFMTDVMDHETIHAEEASA